jgi:hypothetical protein
MRKEGRGTLKDSGLPSCPRGERDGRSGKRKRKKPEEGSMLLKYVGPNPPKLINRFWGKEYLFNPSCEVDDADAKLMLEDWPDLFQKADPGNPEGPGSPVEPVKAIEAIEPAKPAAASKPAREKKRKAKNGPGL